MTEPGSQHVLLVDDDSILLEGLAMALQCEGRTLILCHDIEAAEMALSRFPITHVVSDVQFTSGFGFEGLHFANRSRDTRPHRMILMTGAITEALRAAAPTFGVDAILEKPFRIDELERALNIGGEPTALTPGQVIDVPSLEQLIETGGLTSIFQPIVMLDGESETVFGFEALMRPRAAWALGGVAELFEYATRRSLLGLLNRATARLAIAESRSLPDDAVIFINVDPSALDAEMLREITRSAASAALPLSRVVLEITERSNFSDEAAAAGVITELRARGVRFALDDHGSAYSHLGMLHAIAPSFIKISSSFGIDFEGDVYKQRIVQHIVTLARDCNAQPILEGIETAETAAAARRLGVNFAQGYFFGRPAEAGQWSHVAAA